MAENLNTEKWMPIVGYEGIYAVSNYGRVKSMERHIPAKGGILRLAKEKIIKPYTTKLGYKYVGLHKNHNYKNSTVHRLVANAFIENTFGKPQVNHKNGNPSDNTVHNLEWVTCQENIRHSFDALNRKPNKMKGDKCWLFGKKGKDHPGYGNKHALGRIGALSKRSKKVKCTTLDIEFESACIASRALGIDQPSISTICHGKRTHIFGLTFRYI